MWNKDEMQGKMEHAKGKAKEELGDMTGDDKMRDEGRAEEIGGNARDTLGKGRRKVGEALDDLGDEIKR